MEHIKYIVSLILCMASFRAGAQKTTTVSDISFTYTIEEELLKCTLEAKTNGWIGVGFNDKNSIVNSDLLLFNIIKGKASNRDLYVKSAGNPRRDSDLGGTNTIQLISGVEKDGITSVVFSIPLNSGDPFDFEHHLNEPFWLILAYSKEDDFEHHSRVRKHISFKLETVK